MPLDPRLIVALFIVFVILGVLLYVTWHNDNKKR